MNFDASGRRDQCYDCEHMQPRLSCPLMPNLPLAWVRDGASCPIGRWDSGFVSPSRGLGDTLEKLFKLIGFGKRTCGGCKNRRDKLNKIFPYRS